MATTSGSSEAACTNSTTAAKESYGRCSSRSPRRMIAKMSSLVASCAGIRGLNGGDFHTSELQAPENLERSPHLQGTGGKKTSAPSVLVDRTLSLRNGSGAPCS